MKYILLFIVTVLLFSCNKKKENNSGNIQQEKEQTSLNKLIINNIEEIKSDPNGPATEEEKEAMKKLIYLNDEHIKTRGIFFIERAYFGISGGENWIIELNENEWGNKFIYIYVINDDKIIKDYNATVSGLNFLDRNANEISEYDIMRDIPGTHIPDGVNSFGDFNGDGIAELFKYINSYLVGSNIDIFHYDSQKEGFVSCRIPFKLIDPKTVLRL